MRLKYVVTTEILKMLRHFDYVNIAYYIVVDLGRTTRNSGLRIARKGLSNTRIRAFLLQ